MSRLQRGYVECISRRLVNVPDVIEITWLFLPDIDFGKVVRIPNE